MSEPEDHVAFRAEEFCGVTRLFPLPNLVLFPHVIQPLHVFEPRYVEMLEESLATDRLIAMALLQPGWEHDYEGRPAIAPVACLARVLTWQALPERRYNLLIVGLRRMRVVRELQPKRLFREVEGAILEDCYPAAAAKARPALLRKLAGAFEELLPGLGEAAEFVEQLCLDKIDLGTLTDVIGYALDLNVAAKQTLLSEIDVDRRCRMLLKHLKHAATDCSASAEACEFPPAFSAN